MSFLVKKIGQKYVNTAVQKTFGDEDPFYDTIQVTKPNGKVKTKRVWKEPPELGLCEKDQEIMRQFSKRAWNLDMFFSFCGMRLGWSAIIGIIPVVGDCINIYLSLRLVYMAQGLEGGLPVGVQSKMMANITMDFLLGITPVLGIIAGALYKSNSRNNLILMHHLQHTAEDNIRHGKYSTLGIGKKKKSGWFTFGSGSNNEGYKDIPEPSTGSLLTSKDQGHDLHTTTNFASGKSHPELIELSGVSSSQDSGVFQGSNDNSHSSQLNSHQHQHQHQYQQQQPQPNPATSSSSSSNGRNRAGYPAHETVSIAYPPPPPPLPDRARHT
ncbi:uncharacterized protein SAPINGB_P003005 [Magnusiomyces paraingens]|uniref:Uncharacterized protein n=1 Tax=Magnusiomyces paraingens TaxID=2606893 RepID=A0A5E8BHN5_9ASCO|nr:uncharacterized protein SAPINGB_P003005 [Saprochaete ingens]VVT51164.1 unnamed protein product [Saprochaete ingens]